MSCVSQGHVPHLMCGETFHCESKKNPGHLDFCPYLSQLLTDIQNSFTDGLAGGFAIVIIKHSITP